jgi:cell division inhibitor SepF
VGLWRDIKARLGLAEDYDEYDEYEDAEELDEEYEPTPRYRSPYDDVPSTIRRVQREPDLVRAREASSRGGQVTPGPGMQAVPQVKMHIAEPKAFSEAQTIADRFKNGMPVIMNLTGTDPDLAKRLIDFASGLTYGLNGGLQKVSDRVFMLTPANVDVTAAQRAVLRDKGLFSVDG